MELRQIRYFIAVAEELHFRNAGKKLRISQPSLSLQIRLLEEELNVILLERTNRKVALTPAGALFLHRGRMALDALSRACVDAQKTMLGETGSLSVGFNSTAGFSVLPKFVKSLAKALPKVECKLNEQSTASLFRLLEERAIDLAFLHAAFVPSTLSSAVVDREQLQAVLAKTHKLARRESVRADELCNDLNFLPEPQASQALHEMISNVFSRNGGMPTRTQRVEHVQTAIALVANGMGVVLAPESAAPFLPKNVVMIPLEPRVTGITTLAVWRREDQPPLLRRVLKLLPKMPK